MQNVYTVGQINSYIRRMFAEDFLLQELNIKGEVSNCKYHSSGHIYFTLKDMKGTISCVMFAGNRSGLSFRMTEGMQVVVQGTVDVYERDGKYQVYAKRITLDGEGALFERFQRLKEELLERGMFAPEYKKPIPKYIRTLGVVTASTGAAVRDIINITHRRNPYVQILLYPAIVQGEGAADSIVRGIHMLEQQKVDVMIVGRGGGSIEDLWAFNEEITARAVAASELPVISAVGHETDFTISDFVADLRAPTPSAAAELAVPDIMDLYATLSSAESRLSALLRQKLAMQQKHFALLSERISAERFSRRLLDAEQCVARAQRAAVRAYKNKTELAEKRLAALCGKLSALSPIAVFERGYSVAMKDGKNIASAEDINTGDAITVKMTGGELDCSVTERRLTK